MDQSAHSFNVQPEALIPVLAVIGAGPKAAAIAVKAQVLKELGLGNIDVVVIEKTKELAANWAGHSGFTDGKGSLGTPPEKDVGFPYSSIFGSAVDFAMLRYSWQAYLIDRDNYSNWIDRGKPQPRHEIWADYLRWALGLTSPSADEARVRPRVMEGRATRIELFEGRLKIEIKRPHTSEFIEADGVVFTGPGEPKTFGGSQPESSELIMDGRNYWQRIGVFEKLGPGRVAIIGGGETAASIAVSLIERAPELKVDIINRHGAVYSRGEGFDENRFFSNPDEWLEMDEAYRAEFIHHTDRGVFSVDALKRIALAENVKPISGEISEISEVGDKVVIDMSRAGIPTSLEYDRVIVALGFDPWAGSLEMFPIELRPTISQEDLMQGIDYHLRVRFDSAPALINSGINAHMPMVAGMAQGPGFPNLSCLGHVADRILSLYLSALHCKQARDDTWFWERVTPNGKSMVKEIGFATREEAELSALMNGWRPFTRITRDPNVMGGKLCIRGLRVTVRTILGLIASGHSPDEILKLYPYLEEEDLRESLAYGEEVEPPPVTE